MAWLMNSLPLSQNKQHFGYFALQLQLVEYAHDSVSFQALPKLSAPQLFLDLRTTGLIKF